MSRYGNVSPLSNGWYNRLDSRQRERVDSVVRRALNAASSFEELAERTGLEQRVLTALRRHEVAITLTHARALAPLIGTTVEDVVSGAWKVGQI